MGSNPELRNWSNFMDRHRCLDASRVSQYMFVLGTFSTLPKSGANYLRQLSTLPKSTVATTIHSCVFPFQCIHMEKTKGCIGLWEIRSLHVSCQLKVSLITICAVKNMSAASKGCKNNGLFMCLCSSMWSSASAHWLGHTQSEAALSVEYTQYRLLCLLLHYFICMYWI